MLRRPINVAIAVTALMVALSAPLAWGQFAQYTAAGGLAGSRGTTKDAVDSAMDQARWRLGPIRVAPWIGVRDISYYANTAIGEEGEKESDFTVSAGAGLHAYLPVGSRFVLAAYAVPEYVWWHKAEERRRWNGRYGVGIFAYFRRLTIEAKGGRWLQQEITSAELEVPVHQRNEFANVNVELEIFEQLSLFARGEEQRSRSEELGLGGSLEGRLVALDRDERKVGGGLRYRFREWFAVAVGTDELETDFTGGAEDRSSSGSAPFAEMELIASRFDLRLTYQRSSLEPTPGSTFAPFEQETGRFTLGWKPAGRYWWQLYGGRAISYSLEGASPYYTDDRVGVALATSVLRDTAFRAFWETGRLDYAAVEGGAPARKDDVESYGVTLQIPFGRRSALGLSGYRITYDASDAALDRTVTSFRASLRLGSADPGWW